jgi:RNA polymerase sigma-70 factor (ECF subfamily)
LVDLPDKDSVPDSNFLLERLKEGDRKVFTQLFEYYYSGLVIYADRYLHDLGSAEDVVQSVFIRLWENRHTIKSVSLRYFLINSVKNSCVDLLRKTETQEKYIRRQMNQFTDFGDDFWAEGELKEMIKTAVNNLPARCREIFMMSRFDGLKSKEIAQKLHLSQRTVETQITHALRILRKDLKDYLFQFLFIF